MLERCLQGKNWLVGDKITFADLAFVSWNDRLDVVLMVGAEIKFSGFPNLQAWHERMVARPSWNTAMEIRAKLMDEQGLTWNGMPKGVSDVEEYMKRIEVKP